VIVSNWGIIVRRIWQEQTSVELHNSRLRGQVVGDLIVGEPVQRHPEEDFASIKTTSDLLDPGVIDVAHPFGRTGTESARLDGIPETALVVVTVRANRVDGPLALACHTQQLESTAEDGSSRRSRD
jgi:hypothetical protein